MYSFDLTPTCCWANKNPAVSRMSLSHDNDLKNTSIFVALCVVTKKKRREVETNENNKNRLFSGCGKHITYIWFITT